MQSNTTPVSYSPNTNFNPKCKALAKLRASRDFSGSESAPKNFDQKKCSSYIPPEYTRNNNTNSIKQNKDKDMTNRLRSNLTVKLRSSLSTALFDFGPTEPLLDPWVKEAIDCWNNIPEQRSHRVGTKLYEKTITLLEKLFEGSLFRYDNNGLRKYSERKFTLNEFKQSLRNFLTACHSESHYPLDKKVYKKINLADWLYNPHSPYGTKSLFAKYLAPPKRIEFKSQVKVNSERMLNEFQKLHTENLTPVKLDETKKSLNRLYNIWKKIPWQYTQTTMPDNLGPEEMVGLFLDFTKVKAKGNFTVGIFSQEWLWESFEKYLAEQGYLEWEEYNEDICIGDFNFDEE